MKITSKSSELKIGVGSCYLKNSETVEFLIGRVLTIIDTLGLKDKQDKSVKDLIKQEIRSYFREEDWINQELASVIVDMKWKLNKYYKETQSKCPNELVEYPGGQYDITFTDDK